jgi:hypothetical protein
MWTKKYIIWIIAILAISFIASSCSDDDDEKNYLEVSNINLKAHQEGIVNSGPRISIISLSYFNIFCVKIKEGDQIQTIEAYTESSKLVFDIITQPNNSETPFKNHDVSFLLKGLKRGKYNVRVKINGIESEAHAYKFDLREISAVSDISQEITFYLPK